MTQVQTAEQMKSQRDLDMITEQQDAERQNGRPFSAYQKKVFLHMWLTTELANIKGWKVLAIQGNMRQAHYELKRYEVLRKKEFKAIVKEVFKLKQLSVN